MTILADIEGELRKPFAIEEVDLRPKGKHEDKASGKVSCMALAYADPRVYQDRLNKLAYGEWTTPAPVVIAVGSKLVCYVTVILFGVPHTDVGEGDPGENQGTEAWAQGFKRACSQFGLGRYLYDLEKEWVPYSAQKKIIDLNAAEQRAIILKMYKKAGIVIPGQPQAAQQPQNGATSHPTAAQPQAPSAPAQPVVELSAEEHKAKVSDLKKRAVAVGAFTDPASMARYLYLLFKRKVTSTTTLSVDELSQIDLDLASREAAAKQPVAAGAGQ